VAEALEADEAGRTIPDDDLSAVRLAKLYVAYLCWTEDADATAADPLFWTSELLDILIQREPGLALEIVLACVDEASSPADVAVVAAGPLEDLIARQGAAVIDLIEEAAARSARVRYALSGVWPQGRADSPVWARILAARAPGPDLDRGDPLLPAGEATV
jgi:hypothetical protein